MTHKTPHNPKLRKVLLGLTVLCLGTMGFAQQPPEKQTYSIDITGPEKEIVSTLNLGGTNPQSDVIAVNNYYLSKNGRPIIPITGEFHFSRYPEAYWDEAIKKMKAGGINMMATYVFWIMHEEEEGVFVFDGNRNVRKFVQLCAKNDLPVIIRIGPFGHGEIRSGALPDWLLAKPLNIRSNDPPYLYYAERLYAKIGEQLKGLYFKDGGPIIATQIENEYQQSAAPRGLTYPGQPLDYTSSERDRAVTQEGVGVADRENPYEELGNDHMKVLKSLALKAGIDTPLYTVTGWGNSAFIPNESLPVTAAYAYPTWTKNREPSPFYLYKQMHGTPDYQPVRYDATSYPAFAAELGGGIMATYARRPVIPAKSIDALINRCLGSGANGIGYYMYHGGSTPRGKLNYFNDEAYGYPKISYDFQAPIGEFGQTKESYHRIKLLHFFINAFAEKLAPMTTILPVGNENIKPTDTEKLRYAVRHTGDSGFLFFNNFQDHVVTEDLKDIKIHLKTIQGELTIPEVGGFDLQRDDNAIFPFNLDIEGIQLNYATSQLLTKLEDGETSHYIFFSLEGITPQFSFKKDKGLRVVNGQDAKIEQNGTRWLINCPEKGTSRFTLKMKAKTVEVFVVDKATALKTYEIDLAGKQHLVFSKAEVLQTDQGLQFISKAENMISFSVYPKINGQPKSTLGALAKAKGNRALSNFVIDLPSVDVPFTSAPFNEKRLVVSLKGGLPELLNNVILKIDYVGDTVMAFQNGSLVADEFYKGIPWELGLRNFITEDKDQEMNFYFRPIYEDAPYLIDLDEENIPDFSKKKSIVNIKSVEFIPVYQSRVQFEK